MSTCHWEQMDPGHFLFTWAFEYIFFLVKFMTLHIQSYWTFLGRYSDHLPMYPVQKLTIKVMLLTTQSRDRIQEFKVSTPKKYSHIKDCFLTKLHGDINTIIQQVN